MRKSIEPLERRLLLASTLRIDVGSHTNFVDSNGQTWVADYGYSGGTVSTNSFPVAGTTDDSLYVTRRWGKMSYALPVDNGAYTLGLYFTEPVMTKKGERKFNVSAEGASILSNFDLFAAAGYQTSFIKTFPVTISDGVLNLSFTNVVNNAIVSAIQLIPRDTLPPAQPAGFTASGSISGNLLQWTANSESDLAGYSILHSAFSAGPFTTLTSVTKGATQYLDGSTPIGTPEYYELIAFDSSSNNSAPAIANATRPADTSGAIRINTGGPAQTVAGLYWYAGNTSSGPWGVVDGGFGYAQYPVPAINNVSPPADAAIYQTEWTGGTTTGMTAGQTAFTYHLFAGNGNWLVRLHFDELNKPGPGLRLFDVNINGTPELEDFDVYAQSGGEDNAIVEEFPVTVSSNLINIAFITEVENAKVSGIELIPQGPVGPVPPRTTLSWTDGTVQSPVARYEPISIQVGTKLFIMGGFTGFDLGVTDRVDIYDLATQTWSSGSPLPGAQTHAAAASDGTYIYVAGGQLGGGESSGTGTNQVWRYDIANDLWSPFTPLPDVRYGGTMKIIDNVLHYVGGDYADRFTISTLNWAFDLSTGTQWTTLAPIPIGADHLASAVVDGEWYTIGGEHDHGTLYTQQPYVFEYDPASDTWTRKADIPIARSHIEGTTLVINGNIYVLGGQTAHLGMTADVEEYDPINDVWWQLASLPGVRKGAAAAFYDGQILLVAGQSYYHVESGSYVTTVSNP